MFARGRTFRCKRTSVWQILFCLTVIAFLLRAFIPAGYMPDLSGQRGSSFAVVVCNATGGNSVMMVDFSDPASKSANDDASGAYECPFGLSVAQKLLPGHESPGLSVGLVSRPVSLAESSSAIPALLALGPPLGSRAPPAFLG